MDKSALTKEIKTRIALSSVVKTAVELRGRSPNFMGLCPFHQEKTPSFHVRDQLGRFKCFGCGAAGDIFEFVMRLRGIGFAEAVGELAEKAGFVANVSKNIPRRQNGTIDALKAQSIAQEYFLQEMAHTERGLAARRYLQKERGLSDKMIHQAGLGYGGESTDAFIAYLSKRGVNEKCALEAGLLKQGRFSLAPQFLLRITFPIRNYDGRIIAFGGRSFLESDQDSPKYVNTHAYQHYEKRKSFYGLFESKAAILKGMTPLLVEGYFDAMAAWALGMPALALCGTAFSHEHAEIIRKLSSRLIICFDSDAAGRAALNALLIELYRSAISPSLIVLRKKDPGSYLSDGSLSELKNLIAEPIDALCNLIDHGAIQAQGGVSERIRQIDMLLPVFASIKRPLMRRQYVAYLAKRLHEDSSLLWSEIEQRIKKETKRLGKEFLPQKQELSTQPLKPNERLLIEIILSKPELVSDMSVINDVISPDICDLIRGLGELFLRDPVVTSESIEALVKTVSATRWPAIDDILKNRIILNQQEAEKSLHDVKAQIERKAMKDSLKKKRLELQDFENKRDFASVLTSLKEKSKILQAGKPKSLTERQVQNANLVSVQEPTTSRLPKKYNEINNLDEELSIFDPSEDWQ